MLNLMRNLLLNLSDTQQTLTVSEEFRELIPDTFQPISYSPDVEWVRAILVSRSSPDKAAFDARQALVLAHSSELEAYLRPIENVFTFEPQTKKHFNSGFAYDLVALDRRYSSSPTQETFLRTVSSSIDRPVYQALVRIQETSDTPVVRVGAVVTLFLLHGAALLGKING